MREATGVPAGEWLRRVKLQQVADALARTRHPLKRIGADLGYANDASLHRVFRRATGLTPAPYRNAYAEDAPGDPGALS